MRPEQAGAGESERESLPLAEVQAALLSYITGLPAPGGAGGAPLPDVADLIEGDERAEARERLAVYAYMYGARLREALESQFPRLARLVGAARFADIAAAYAADHPSRDPSLRSLGARLPEWLEGRRACAAWLADLARLEWARADVFDAADEPLLAVDDLRAWPADRFGALPVRLVAAHRVVTADDAIADLWDGAGRRGDGNAHEHAGDGDCDGEVPPAPSVAEARDPAGETLLVWRQAAAVYHRAVDEDEAAALALAAKGTSFGLVCESLAARHAGDVEAAAARAFGWLSTWLADGLLISSPS